MPPADVLLLIEVADSSLSFDRGVKAGVCAALGVSEYWVINANTLSTRVHREPAAEGYTWTADVAADDVLQPVRLTALSLRLAELGLD